MHNNGFEGKHSLVARFFIGQVLNMEAIAQTSKLLWHTKKGFEVRDIGNHQVLFVFSEDSVTEKVLSGEPWSLISIW